MPRVDFLAHLPVHSFAFDHTVEAVGSVDVGTDTACYLTPVRLVMRADSWEDDLDRILDVLNDPTLRRKIAAEVVKRKPAPSGPRKKTKV
jgi:hypothetical protein